MDLERFIAARDPLGPGWRIAEQEAVVVESLKCIIIII
jgi:hypothetical protein